MRRVTRTITVRPYPGGSTGSHVRYIFHIPWYIIVMHISLIIVYHNNTYIIVYHNNTYITYDKYLCSGDRPSDE